MAPNNMAGEQAGPRQPLPQLRDRAWSAALTPVNAPGAPVLLDSATAEWGLATGGTDIKEFSCHDYDMRHV